MTKKNKKANTRRYPSLTFGIVILSVLLLVVQIVLSNRLATEGKTLEDLEAKISQLRLENKRLKAEKAELVSLSEIASQTDKYGFKSDPRVLILQPGKSVALKTEP